MAEAIPQPFANQTLPEDQTQALPTSSGSPPSKPVVVEFGQSSHARSVTDLATQSARDVVARGRDGASVLYERVQARASVIRRKTDEALRRARQQGRHLVNEHPMQVIAGIAAAAFVGGMLLRFWRSSRYE